MRILSVGEILWDVFEAEAVLGGAPLNFCVAAQRLGHSAALMTGVGADEDGRLAVEQMRSLGLSTELVQTIPGAETGKAVVKTDADGNATFIIKRLAAYDLYELSAALLARAQAFEPDWIYFGTLAQARGHGKERLERLLTLHPGVRCLYDINLREGHWDLNLVKDLAAKATITKLNDAEAKTLFGLLQANEIFSIENFCRFWSSAFGGEVLCVTLGDAGCAVWQEGRLHRFEGYPVRVVDTVGSGDAFAAAFLHGFTNGWTLERTAQFANALGALIASRVGATPAWEYEECLQLID